ncbi:MAG: hypothetical protein H7125_12970 [Proteobacteria bacterium]|nr:hypothetical protein [Burkholderiales bacterium]
MNYLRIPRLALCVAPLFAASVPLHAQSPGAGFPSKPVRIIVPWPAGGGTDFAARVIAQKMSERTGQSFIVDNRAGAAGNIGAEAVAKAAPDGYTMLLAITSVSINPALVARMPFDIVKDFAPVTLVARAPMVLAVHPVLPASNARAN